MLIDHRSNSISFRSDLSVDQKEEVMDGPYFQVGKKFHEVQVGGEPAFPFRKISKESGDKI